MAETPRTALMRDSQNRHLGHLVFPAPEWRAFLGDVKEEQL
ncbi:DUF397 domain-containing protein [Nocardiopsis exhalans]